MSFGFSSLPVINQSSIRSAALFVSLGGLVCSMPAQALLTAGDDVRAVPAGTPILVDVLNNDVSDDGQLIISRFTQPANGSVTRAGGGLRYQPNAGFSGYDSFTYSIQNSSGVTSAVVEIAVGDVPERNVVTVAPLAIANMARESMASHRHAINQFVRLGASFAALNRHAIPLAGVGAGDGLMPAGGVFVSVDTRTTKQSETEYLSAYEGGLSGFTAGADFVANSRWFFGGALGYSQGNADHERDENSQIYDVDNSETSLIGMANYQGDALLAQIQVGFSRQAFTWEGVNHQQERYSAQTSGSSQFVHGQVDYAFAANGWQLMPSVGLVYESASFDDTQARLQDFSGGKNSHLQAVISLHVDYAATFNWGVLLPQLSIANEQIVGSDASINALPDFDGSQALYADKQQLRIDAGLAMILPHGVSGFINYQSLTGHQNYQSAGLQAGVRWEF